MDALNQLIDWFQSTLPTRGSDDFDFSDVRQVFVSIHAPHEGERRDEDVRDSHRSQFQSTLPTRGSDGGKVHLYAAFPRIC